MKDFPMFTTEYGVASLLLKEIPYKETAYIIIRSSQEPEELLKECISFCRMVGAEKIYARGHEFLETLGVNFGRLHDQGIDAMVSKIIIEYKQSLKSGDRFVVGMNIRREGAKIVFYQDIYRLSDGKLCTKGVVESICVVDGRLTRGELFDEIFKDKL